MDLLRNKIYQVGDLVYFLFASIENPFLYMRSSGKIVQIENFIDRAFYNIQHYKFLEVPSFIDEHLHEHRIRMKSPNAEYINKKIRLRDYSSKQDVDSLMLERYPDWYYNIPVLLTFDTIESMNMELQRISLEMEEYLRTHLNSVEKRILK